MVNREASQKAVRRERRPFVRRWHLILFLALFLSPPLMAQDNRTVRVDGRQMRVRVAGLREDVRGRPVVVFESGAGTGLTAWSAVLPDVSQFATVVAYDRAGIGESEADEHAPRRPTSLAS